MGFVNVKFGYRCATEEHTATELIKNARIAEKFGFDFVVASDHFHPWFHTDGHTTFTLSWLGALGMATEKVAFGTAVTPPILRYHPALIAQAFASLENLFPGRVFVGVGTGEAMNEVPLGFPWPAYHERLERLREAVEVMRLLWKQDFVSYKGKYFTLTNANLYDKPEVVPPVYIAGAGEHAVTLAGSIGDGYMTVPLKEEVYKANLSTLKQALDTKGTDFDTFPKMVEVFVAYDEDYDRALEHIRRWKTVLIPNVLNRDVYDPRVLEELSKSVDDSELTSVQANVCTNTDELIKTAERYARYGFNMVQLHSSSPDEGRFLNDFGAKCLPLLRQEFAV